MKSIPFVILSLWFLTAGCTDYIDNTRVYVEGQITSSPKNNQKIELLNGSLLLSKTTSDLDGNFSMGSAGTTQTITLTFTKKMESFSSSEENCVLTYDSLGIEIPEGIGYVKFNSIVLEP